MEKKVNVLVADDNSSVTDAIKKYFSSHSSINVVKTCSNGREALNYILNYPDKYDLVLMDILLPEIDGLEILDSMQKNNILKKVIIISSYKKESIVKKISSCNVNYYMLKPFDMDSLEKRILELDDNGYDVIDNTDNNITLAISKLLHSLGMPSHIKGYQYIRDSIIMMYDNPEMIGGITKEIYPEVADKYETTSSRVERAIRHAIEVSWTRGDLEIMEQIFGNSVDYDRAKPTNSEFIATIADKLRVDKNFMMA